MKSLGVVLNIVVALALPITVFVAGAWGMSAISGRQYVQRLLNTAAAPDRKPLNQRFGYDLNDVDRHWAAFVSDPRARASERRFLEIDLVFPFFYGAALATSLLMLWAMLGRSFNPGWLLVPVVITLLADWTENLVQIFQFQRYADAGKEGLSAGWLQVASSATILKLVFFIASFLLIVVIAMVVLFS